MFHVLIKDKYFPNISGDNGVWVLTNKHCDCIFSYYTKTDKFSMELSEKKLKNICYSVLEVHLKYYSHPKKWKEKIHEMYNGDMYALWRDGWFEELEYCDYIINIKEED